MKQLWAPWRMTYIEKANDPGCIFCEFPKEENDKQNLILYRGNLAFIMMNLYPYNSGHIMIAPYAHAHTLSILDRDSLIEMTLLTKKSVELLERLFAPEGMNVGMNIGKTAGAGFDRHVHMHVVPRWNGDTNFMPVLGDTKVMPQHIEETYEKMVVLFREIDLKLET